MKILAVIPARGGSKRLPKKNILPLGGKPLISWTIESAQQSGVCMDIIVSTDDPEIAAVAERAGIRVPALRPSELATDDAGTLDVLKHCLLEYQRDSKVTVDALLLLQPTCPFRTPESIRQCVELFKSQGSPFERTLVSFSKVGHPVEWTFKIADREIFPIFGWEMLGKRSQELAGSLRLNGSIYVASVVNILSKSQLVNKESIPYVMEGVLQGIDIDEIDDYNLAKKMVEER